MRVRGATLLACATLLVSTGAAAQTCRTSLSTGTIVCDNGATARTSPVTGTTTFSDGRTARTSPVTGTTRFSDGTSFRTNPVRVAPPPSIAIPQAEVEADTAEESETKPWSRKRPVRDEKRPGS
jgi:hypothetical protein